MSRAPFHWDGEMPEMNTLVNEVMLQRMGFNTALAETQVGVLSRWMDGIPAAPALKVGAPFGAETSFLAEAVERGKALFVDETVGCGSCHSGPTHTDNRAYDVGTGGVFFTPTLIGIGLRRSFMRDGCASTLRDRFGLCGGGDAHGETSHLVEDQVDDLVAYMMTL
jgi:Cytochrome c